MVADMAGEDVGQGAHGEGIIAGDAAPSPGFWRQGFEEVQAGLTQMAKLTYVATPVNLIRRGRFDANVLIEAGQRIRKAAGEPKGTEQENAFAVVDVVQQLAHGPLLGLVTMKRFLFRDGA